MKEAVAKSRIRLAWAVAIAVDAIQIIFLPATVEGALSPLTDGLDLIAMALLWSLLGWHWALVPSLAAELVPGLDLVPTWTIAVGIMTRGMKTMDESAAPKDVTPPTLEG